MVCPDQLSKVFIDGPYVARRIDGEANTRVLRLAAAAATASDIERHGDDITDSNISTSMPFSMTSSGDLVAKYEAQHRCRAAPHHVLIRAADIR